MSDVRLVATNPDDNTLVPVASNASGQLAVQSPKIEKVPNDFDVEGDLTVSGNASIAGPLESSVLRVTNAGTTYPRIIGTPDGTFYSETAAGVYPWKMTPNGKANFTNSVDIYKSGSSSSTVLFDCSSDNGVAEGQKDSKFSVLANGQVQSNGYHIGIGFNARPSNNGYAVTVEDSDSGELNVIISESGTAEFHGDVTVGSRSKQWMLVEQGGLCHMVEQARASTADLVDPDFAVPVASSYPKLRDVFAELDVVEKALEQVMEKLRMVEPNGWPVWDGSSNS